MQELYHWTYAFDEEKNQVFYMSHKTTEDRDYHYGLLQASSAKVIGKTTNVKLTQSVLTFALTEKFFGAKLFQVTCELK